MRYVRNLAEARRTAAEVAEETGLPLTTITSLAQRERIQFTARGRRTPRQFLIDIPPERMSVIQSIAKRNAKDPREVATLLIIAVTEQGETFCTNLLDLPS